MGTHARLGPSNHRWPMCPGSVREEANYVDVPGAAAIDGTGSHELLELCLKNNVRAEIYDGQIIGTNHPDNMMGWLISIDRILRVQMCLDYVSTRTKELQLLYPFGTTTVYSESKSNPGDAFGRVDWWGTVDITFVVMVASLVELIEICDYKDGRGWVHAEDNTQLMSYAMGKLQERVLHGNRKMKVRMSIVQPKTNPPVRYQDVMSDYVVTRATALADAAALTDKIDAPLISGKHCQWCKHKPNCTAESEQSIEKVKTMTNVVVGSLFEVVEQTFGDITILDNAKLAELADARAGVEAVFDKVEAEIKRRIETGDKVYGYAMLPGNSSRMWSVGEEEVVKMLKARRLKLTDIYPPKLISVAQVMKLESLTTDQKSRIEQGFVVTKAGELKLKQVRTADKPSVQEIFADVVQPVSFF